MGISMEVHRAKEAILRPLRGLARHGRHHHHHQWQQLMFVEQSIVPQFTLDSAIIAFFF
jgi:hypothetical protein